jgi:biopolymer transport protein ExbD/biopolymer transport protein TolR
MKKTRRNRRRQQVMAELNLTNLVDVTFALLIIFMITAPMMTQGVQVDLPETESENVEVADAIQVSITGRNEIYIDQRKTSLLEFKKAFRAAFAGRVETPVFINADKRIPYGLVIRVISDVQHAGVVKLGFLTLPLNESK